MKKEDSQDYQEFEKMLREQGIMFKGYGVLPKYVMFDRELTAEAKVAYGLICSYAGNQNFAFPGRDTLLAQLGVGKNRFYRHFRLLLEQGYIEKECRRNEHQQFAHNVYILVAQPKKFMDSEFESLDPYITGVYGEIRKSNLKSVGYGFIPKAVMVDERLDIKAKAVYGYLCSVKDAKTKTAKVRKRSMMNHLSISENTYAKYCRQLIGYGYVSVSYRDNIHVYTLHEYPRKNGYTDLPKNEDTVARKNGDTVVRKNRYTVPPKNEDTTITSTNITSCTSTTENSTSFNISQSAEVLENSEVMSENRDFAPNDPIDTANIEVSNNSKVKIQSQEKPIKGNQKKGNSANRPKQHKNSSSAENNAGKQSQGNSVPYKLYAAPAEIDAVKRELIENAENGKLLCFADSKHKMRVAVEALFAANNDDISPVYKLVKDCTVQLLCNNTQAVDGTDYFDILEKFNDYVDIGYDGSISFSWVDKFISDYSEKLPKYDVKNIFAYTKASIVHHLYVDSVEKSLSLFKQPERRSSFNIEDFFRKSVEAAMRAD